MTGLARGVSGGGGGGESVPTITTGDPGSVLAAGQASPDWVLEEYHLTGLTENTDISSAIQAVVDAFPTGVTIKIPTGTYRLAKPVHLKSAHALVGSGREQTILDILSWQAGIFMGPPKSGSGSLPAWPHGPALAYGGGDWSWKLENVPSDGFSTRWFNFSRNGVQTVDSGGSAGWAVFNFETTIRPHTIFATGETAIVHYGDERTAEEVVVSHHILWVGLTRISDSTGALIVDCLIGGVEHSFFSSATLSLDTTYHIALDLDASDNLRLFINGVLDTKITGCTGTLLAAAHDELQFGAYVAWPDTSENMKASNCYVGTTRLTRVSRRGSDSSFTPPTSYTADNDDAILLEPKTAYEDGYWHQVYTGQGINALSWAIVQRGGYQVTDKCAVRGLSLRGISNVGSTGIFIYGTIHWEVRDVSITACNHGLEAFNNCYFGSVERLYVNGGGGGGRVAHRGVYGQVSGSHMRDFEIHDVSYSFICTGQAWYLSDGVMENPFKVAIFHKGAPGGAYTNLSLGVESSPFVYDYAVLCELIGATFISSQVFFHNIIILAQQDANQIPVGIIGGGDHRGGMYFSGEMSCDEDCPEFIKFFNPDDTPPLLLGPTTFNNDTNAIPLSLSTGKIRFLDQSDKPLSIADADTTIRWEQGRFRYAPTLTADRTYTVSPGTSGTNTPRPGIEIWILRTDASSKKLTIVDGGTGTPTLAVTNGPCLIQLYADAAGPGVTGNINWKVKAIISNPQDLLMFAGNSTTVPTVNPTAGHLYYSAGGAPHWRCSDGTVL